MIHISMALFLLSGLVDWPLALIVAGLEKGFAILGAGLDGSSGNDPNFVLDDDLLCSLALVGSGCREAPAEPTGEAVATLGRAGAGLPVLWRLFARK